MNAIQKAKDTDNIIFKTQSNVKPKDLRMVEKNKDKVLVVHSTSLKISGDDILADLGLWRSNYLVLYYMPVLTFEDFKKWYLKCVEIDDASAWYAPPGYTRGIINDDTEVL